MEFTTKVKMTTKQTKYELLNEKSAYRQKCIYLQVGLLLSLCIVCGLAVYSTWSSIYRYEINIPPKLIDIPQLWVERTITYTNILLNNKPPFNDKTNGLESKYEYASTMKLKPISAVNRSNVSVIRIESETIYPSKLGNFVPYAQQQQNRTKPQQRLVCYYASPIALNQLHELYPNQIDPYLCTHINVGIVTVENNRLVIDDTLNELLKQMSSLQRINADLKILIWIGGPSNSVGFVNMIANHANRKEFIQSVKATLMKYRLDGIDLDWEFPIIKYQRRLHFSQLLHEIRREYEREQRTYILSVAAAAIEGIAYFAYDINVMNENCDYVNIMTYDYHFYSSAAPFTGFNAPLYRQDDEHSVFATLNINASVSFWQSSGLDKSKIVVGLPTYGHSFHLVNPFNAKIGAPSNGNGRVGQFGFVTYSDVCWFDRNNYFVTKVFDTNACSPYIYAGSEWMSYEDERSITCKTNYVKKNEFGGVMIYSLNTDDYSSYCDYGVTRDDSEFPLTRITNSILFQN